MESELIALIPQYVANKTELDGYKKICEEENSKIKDLMLNLNLDETQSGNYIAKRVVQKRENFNEDMLLMIAHHYGIPEIVKTKEYIDFDALENAIYTGNISKEILTEINKAREVKEVVTLRIARVKEGEKK